MKRFNNREYYRINYPPESRPRFVFGDQICEVLNCSERGIYFQLALEPPPAVGTEIGGRLRMAGGAEVPLHGLVVRAQPDGKVALRLKDPGLSFYAILKEQIYLRRDGRR